MDTGQKYEEVARKALDQLLKYFNNPDSVHDRVAAHAASVASSFTRYLQQMRSKEGMIVMVAKELAEDREQFAKYIAVSLPDFPLVKRLKGKKE